MEPLRPVRACRRRQGRWRRFPPAVSWLRPRRRRKADAQCRKREALARSRHDVQRGQERLRLVGYRRSGAAFGDRVRAQRRSPCRIGRDGVAVLRLDAASGTRRNHGRGGAHHGRDVPAWHQPRERPAASYPLHDLQCRTNAPGRQIPGVAPAPGLCLDEGCRGGLPQCLGVEPAGPAWHTYGAVWQGQ